MTDLPRELTTVNRSCSNGRNNWYNVTMKNYSGSEMRVGDTIKASAPRWGISEDDETCRSCGETKVLSLMYRCGNCQTHYCGRDCQKKDWSKHKAFCQNQSRLRYKKESKKKYDIFEEK